MTGSSLPVYPRSIATVPGIAPCFHEKHAPGASHVSILSIPPNSVRGNLDSAGSEGPTSSGTGASVACVVTASKRGKFCHIVTQKYHRNVDGLSGRDSGGCCCHCTVVFEREVESVALALRPYRGLSGDLDSPNNGSKEAVLFVATRDGRLWRSCHSTEDHGVEFSRGVVRVGRCSNREVRVSVRCRSVREPFFMVEFRRSNGSHFVNCADILALRLDRNDSCSGASDNKPSGAMVVTAGSTSLDTPMVAFIPDKNAPSVTKRSKKKRKVQVVNHLSAYGERIPGLDGVDSRVTSILFVSKQLLGPCWNRLQELYTRQSDCSLSDNNRDTLYEDSAILIGFEDGVIRFSPAATKWETDSDSYLIKVGRACPVHQLSRPQALTLLLLKDSEEAYGICSVGSLGTVSLFNLSHNHSFHVVEPGLQKMGTWTSATPYLNQRDRSDRFGLAKVDEERCNRDESGCYSSFLATCENGSTFLCTINTYKRREPGHGVCSITFALSSVRMQVRSDISSVSCCGYPNSVTDRSVGAALAFTTQYGSLIIMDGVEQNYRMQNHVNGHLNHFNKPDESEASGVLHASTSTGILKSRTSPCPHEEQEIKHACLESRAILACAGQLQQGTEKCMKVLGSGRAIDNLEVDSFVTQMREAARVISKVRSVAINHRACAKTRDTSDFPAIKAEQEEYGPRSSPICVHASLGMSFSTSIPFASWVQSCHAVESAKSLAQTTSVHVPVYVRAAHNNSGGFRNIAYGGTGNTSSTSREEEGSQYPCVKIRVHQWDSHPITAVMSVSKLLHPIDNMLWHDSVGNVSGKKRGRSESNCVGFFSLEATVYAQTSSAGRQRKKARSIQDSALVGFVVPIPTGDMDMVWDLFSENNNKKYSRENSNGDSTWLQENNPSESFSDANEEDCIRSHCRRPNIKSIEALGSSSGQQTQSCSIVLRSKSLLSKLVKAPDYLSVTCTASGLTIAAVIHECNTTNESSTTETANSRKCVLLRLSIGGNVDVKYLPCNLALLRASLMHRIEEHYCSSDGGSSVPMVEAANTLGVYQQSLTKSMSRKKIRYLGKALHRNMNVSSGTSSQPSLDSLIRIYWQLRSLEMPLG